MDVGAAGIAIQSSYSKEAWEEMDTLVAYRDAAAQARLDGYAMSENEVIQGVTSLAVPIEQPGQAPAALAVVFATSTVDSYQPVIEALKLSAGRISQKLAH
ncbi:IclR family transcriptional regulator C-terminal domain-containing protein [Glutamicibacter halophytocola]|uniref:IclR family transcriptional regulator domain-containing protein n=1 Tax=Glutamicibacter halophytocola TaxID=1933880 RepID=UPI00321A2C93